MNKQIILQTSFRLFGILVTLFGIGGLYSAHTFGKGNVSWLVYAVIALITIYGLRVSFKNTRHEIFIKNNQLGWVIDNNIADTIDINQIAAIDIRSYMTTGTRKQLIQMVIIILKDGYERLIPENCYINTSPDKLQKALQAINKTYPKITISTNKFKNNPGYKKYIDWNTSLKRNRWVAYLEPNSSGSYYNCDVDVNFYDDSHVEFEIDINNQGCNIVSPIQLLVDNHLITTFEQKKTQSINKDIHIDVTEVKDYIQAGKIITVKDASGHKWNGPILCYT